MCRPIPVFAVASGWRVPGGVGHVRRIGAVAIAVPAPVYRYFSATETHSQQALGGVHFQLFSNILTGY